MSGTELDPATANYPFLSALLNRRSRRFGLGMKIPSGPLAFESRFQPAPLTEAEEAALAFAACGVTGYAMGDLCYGAGQGGNIMAGLVGRTISSGDCIQTVSLVVINDGACHWLRRPQDFSAAEIGELISLAKKNAFGDIYRRTRIKIKEGRAAPSLEPAFNIAANKWSLHAKGTTYFLPINELSFMYINGLLEVLNEQTRLFILDERAGFSPAGLRSFARSKGGHLEDDPRRGRIATIQMIERLVTEFVTIEQGMMLQNLGLMAETLGLGGFPHFANHDFCWFQELGFRMERMRAARYLGVGTIGTLALNLLGRTPAVPSPIGLEVNGEPILKAYSPPWFPNMESAVRAVADWKFGRNGVFRSTAVAGPWKANEEIKSKIPGISENSIAATVAYCDYVWRRYGRFPAYMPPFRTVLGFQACHLDAEFYERFYRPEALPRT